MRSFVSAVSLAVVLASSAALPALAGQPQPPTPTEKTGPIGAGTPPCRWGGCVKDEANGEWLWFGGTGGVSRDGALLTWTFREASWKRAEFAAPAGLAEVKPLVVEARRLYAAVANRYYQSETEKGRAVKLDEDCRSLAGKIGKVAAGDGPARKAQGEAVAGLNALAAKLGGQLSVAEVAAAREAWMLAVRLEWALSPEPAPRAYPGMAYDAETKKIVLFGGEGIHGAYSDTWVYDCAARKWSEVRPPVAPSPRCGHGMIAAKGKVYLAGGFEPRGTMSYCGSLWTRLPVDVWEFDIKATKWTLLKAGEGKPGDTGMQPVLELALDGEGKRLSWKADVLSYGKKSGEVTGGFDLPGSDAGTDKAGVPAGTVMVRSQGFDPAWYEKVPPADAGAFQATLKALPANKWVNVKPPVRHVNRDWGTTVLDLDRDQLLHWAGGHSSHCGTDVAHFSLATGRWHILATPEMPFEYCYSNDGAHVPTLSGAPWGPHSYLSYGWDQVTGKMLWAGTHGAYRVTNPGGVFVYDPETFEWEVPAPQFEIKGGWFTAERHMTCMVRTPHGLAVWADKYGGTGNKTGLWLADIAGHCFEPVAGTDRKDNTTYPPPAFGDAHGLTYDSKRDRTLAFHFGRKDKHRIWATDLKSKAVTVLEPKGSGNFPAEAGFGREATYLPDDDVVLVPTRCKPEQKVLIYDCAADEWLEMFDPAAADQKGRRDPGYGVSTGVEWDPKRKLLWLVQTDGSVYAMRFERASAGLKPLDGK